MSGVRISHSKKWSQEHKNARRYAKFLCRGCGRQRRDTNFFRMRFLRKVVEIAVSLYHKGMTLKNVKKAVFEIFGVCVSTTAIWKWCKKFVNRFVETIPDLAELLHCDETLLKTYQKGKYIYFWAIKCPKTKMIVAWHLSEARTLHDAKLLFWEARRRFPVGYLPKAIRTDGMPAYRFAIHSVFAYEVKHDRFLSFKNHSNNVIENFFRHKRKFPKFRTLESAEKFIANWVYEYNNEKRKISETFIIRLVKAINLY
jgi:transposase-like protein